MNEFLDQSIYEKNIAHLKNKDYGLAVRVEESELPNDFFLEKAQNGSLTIFYQSPNGDKKYLHSRYNPEQEAKRFVEAQDFEKRLEVFVFGIGLGYHVDLIIEEKLQSINLLEADITLFKLLLYVRDIAHWIDDERIVFIVGVTSIEVMHKISKRNQPRVLWRPKLLVYNPACEIYPSKYKEYIVTCEEDIKTSRTMAATVLMVSLDTMKNSFLNLPYLKERPGVEAWLGEYRDKPVFCVSPGPSLKNAFETLKKAKGRAVIVAVDTAMKPLLRAGIYPDFVIGMDFTPQNKKHYEGVSEEDMKKMVLVADADMYYEIFPMWKGPLFVTYYKHFLSSTFKFKSTMVKGPTTSHMAFLFSFYLGGEPIILIGQDLSYPDIEEAYTPGVSYQRKIHLIKNKKGEELLLKVNKDDPSKKSLTFAERVPAVDGGTVITEPVFLTFGRVFAAAINALNVTVIDAKSKGMKIKGTINMAPEDAFSRYCSEEEKIDVLSRARIAERFFISNIDMEQVDKHMSKVIKEYSSLYRYMQKTFRRMERIYKKGSEKEEWRTKDLKQINAYIDRAFDKYGQQIQFCQLIAGMVSLQVRKHLAFTEDISNKDRLETILAFWYGIRKAAKDVLDVYKQALDLYKEKGLI